MSVKLERGSILPLDEQQVERNQQSTDPSKNVGTGADAGQVLLLVEGEGGLGGNQFSGHWPGLGSSQEPVTAGPRLLLVLIH